MSEAVRVHENESCQNIRKRERERERAIEIIGYTKVFILRDRDLFLRWTKSEFADVVDSTRQVTTLSDQVSEINLPTPRYFYFGNKRVMNPIFLNFFFFLHNVVIDGHLKKI